MTQFSYVTLATWKAENTPGVTGEADSDPQYWSNLRGFSRAWEQENRRKYIPRYRTRYYHADDVRNTYELPLGTDLLAIDSILTNNGDTAISDYFLENANGPPYHTVILDESESDLWLWTGTKQRAHRVTGTWCWHDDWENAWTTGSAINNVAGITADAITVDVDDASAFEIGQLVKCEDEYMLVTDIDTDADVLTVERGYSGTTAATHADSVAITIYVPPHLAVSAIKLLMAWAEGGRTGGEIVTPFGGVISKPAAWPPEVRSLLNRWVSV